MPTTDEHSGVADSPSNKASTRDLGAQVERILALAEEQAAEIRARESRELAQRRAEEERDAAQRRAELAAEVQSAKAYAAKVRADVDDLYTRALQESNRVGDATKAYADKAAPKRRLMPPRCANGPRKRPSGGANRPRKRPQVSSRTHLPNAGRTRSETLPSAAPSSPPTSNPQRRTRPK